MKKTFILMELLLGLFVNVFVLTACSNDDTDAERYPLIATVWMHTTPDNYVYVVDIKTKTEARVSVIYRPTRTKIKDLACKYSYDRKKRIGIIYLRDAVDDADVFYIKGDEMIIYDGENVLILTKHAG